MYDGGNWLYEKEIGCYVHAVYNMRGDLPVQEINNGKQKLIIYKRRHSRNSIDIVRNIYVLIYRNNTSGSKLEEWNRDGMFVGL